MGKRYFKVFLWDGNHRVDNMPCFCVNVSPVSTCWTGDIQASGELPWWAWPAEWNPVVLFSLEGWEKKWVVGKRKEGRMRGWQGMVSVGRQRAKRAKRVMVEGREGWVTEEWRAGKRRKDGRSNWDATQERSPLGLVTQLSLSDTWTLADRVVTASLAQEVSLAGADLWPFNLLIATTVLTSPFQTPPYSLFCLDFKLLHPSARSLVTHILRMGLGSFVANCMLMYNFFILLCIFASEI